MASTIYESNRGYMWRRVKGAEFASASPFVCLVLPITRPITASRKPLQFIVIAVMSVISGTSPIPIGFST
jgi:hypothetical protein